MAVQPPENVGDAIEDMAKCLLMATQAALLLSNESVWKHIENEDDEAPWEAIERATAELGGLQEIADEFGVLAAVDSAPVILEYIQRSNGKPSRVFLRDWHVYLDQAVQYCALYSQWTLNGWVARDTPYAKWIGLYWRPLQTLRNEVARLIRNQAQVPPVYPAGKVPANVG